MNDDVHRISPLAPRPLLEMRGIEKSFPGVRALAEVNLTLGAGRLLALVGENGRQEHPSSSATRAHTPDRGTISIDGRRTPIRKSDRRAQGRRGRDLPGVQPRAHALGVREYLPRAGVERGGLCA